MAIFSYFIFPPWMFCARQALLQILVTHRHANGNAAIDIGHNSHVLSADR
jgi:hypothetical protein